MAHSRRTRPPDPICSKNIPNGPIRARWDIPLALGRSTITETMIDRAKRRFDLRPQRLAGDSVYGAVRLLKWGWWIANHAACSGVGQVRTPRWHLQPSRLCLRPATNVLRRKHEIATVQTTAIEGFIKRFLTPSAKFLKILDFENASRNVLFDAFVKMVDELPEYWLERLRSDRNAQIAPGTNPRVKSL